MKKTFKKILATTMAGVFALTAAVAINTATPAEAGYADTEVALSGEGQVRAEGDVYRVNLYNAWTGDANDTIVAPEATAEASQMIVTFTVAGLGAKSGNAYIAFSAGGWGSHQYWGNDAEYPEIEADKIELKKDGTYTLSVSTKDGSAIGALDFADIQTDIACDEGEKDTNITSGLSIKVKEVTTVKAGFKSADAALSGEGQVRAEGDVYRVNLYNAWTGDVNDTIIDPAITADACDMTVTFTVSGLGTKSGNAYIAFSAGGWGSNQYWGTDEDFPDINASMVSLNADGTYTVSVSTKDGSALGALDFADVQTDIASDADEKDTNITSGLSIKINSVKVTKVLAKDDDASSSDATAEAPTTEAPTTEAPTTEVEVGANALVTDITIGYKGEKDVWPIPASYKYVVQNDIKELFLSINFIGQNGDAACSYNDWCGNGIKVTNPDGTVTWYGFGGAQVGWNASVEADGDEVVPKVGQDNYFALSAAGSGLITLPVVQGATVELFDLCWAEHTSFDHYAIKIVEGGKPEAPVDPTTEAPATEAPATDAPTTEGEKDDAPSTGDAAPIAMAAVVMLVAAAGIVVMKKREI